MTQMLIDLPEPGDAPALPAPTREAALARLAAFQPSMGRHYATKRNFDFGPQDRSNVAGLSPHVRCRLVREEELVRAALDAHGLSGAEKFIQEACWRTYWKGWLEMRPSYWTAYRGEVQEARERAERFGDLGERLATAEAGETGIEPFDVWARELVETGYLHNHARMWFASIWVFTLDLPWALGADHFLRHLMDGDPASNTLSWRWVAGLQTRGKTYLARASNINKYTDGRFRMQGWDLAREAPPLDPELAHPAPAPLPVADPLDRSAPSVLLLTDEDLHPESWGVEGLDVRAVFALHSLDQRSDRPVGARAREFTEAALDDGLDRARAHFGVEAARVDGFAEAARRAAAAGARQVVMMRPFAGPLADRFEAETAGGEAEGAGFTLRRREWDRAFFPHASKGFFKLKEKIPGVLTELGLR